MPSKTFTIKNFEISSFNDFLQAIIKDRTILKNKNIQGNDVYQLLSYYGHLEIMKYLEKEHNWDIHIKNIFGEDAYSFGNYKIKAHLDELYNNSNLEVRLKELEEELKQEKEKNSNLVVRLKQIKETIKNIHS